MDNKLFMSNYMNRNDGSKKIAFITCVNNEKYYDEFKWYVERLIVPEGYSLELIPIRAAMSMAEGYNQGMHATNAKYKIYVHQDVFFINRNYLCDLITYFSENLDVGMIGAIGTNKMPLDGDCWDAWNVGRTIGFTGYKSIDLKFTEEPCLHKDAVLVDGMLMATQYDIEWRTDIGFKFDFYDISQCIEFLERGYHIGIMNQADGSVIHDCGRSNLLNYEVGRKKAVTEYSHIFTAPYVEKQYRQMSETNSELATILQKLFDVGQYNELLASASRFKNVFNTNVEYILSLMDIYNVEKDIIGSYSFAGKSFTEAREEMTSLRFLLRRHYYFGNFQTGYDIKKYISENGISKAAVACMPIYAFPADINEKIADLIIRDKFY